MDIWEVKKNNFGLYEIYTRSKVFVCQIGSGGVIEGIKKKEGDKSTPSGLWQLKNIFYRPDKINQKYLMINKFLSFKKITENCGWCDDYKSKLYNQYIEINRKGVFFPYSYEKLWREDSAYDIFIEIGFNNNPIISKRGSAIFIHCSFEDLRNTAGCVALQKENLLFLINSIKIQTKINII